MVKYIISYGILELYVLIWSMPMEKDKKIRKYKKRKIWPTLILWFAAGVCILGSVSVLVGFSAQDIVERRLYDGRKYSSQYVETIEINMASGMTDTEAIMEVCQNKDNVFVFDKEKNRIIINASNKAFNISAVRLVGHRYSIATEKQSNPDEVVLDSDIFIIDKNGDFSFDFHRLALNLGKINVADEWDDGYIVKHDIWVGYSFGENDRYVLYTKHNVTIRNRELISFFYTLVIASIVILVIMIAMLVSIIRSVRNNNRMLDAIYYDEKTGGNNWVFFRNQSDKYIKKSKKRYAVFIIVNGRYTSCCTCFGGEAGDELIKNTYKVINDNLNSGEFVAVYSEAVFGGIIQYTLESEIKPRIEQILSQIEDFSSGIGGSIQAGLYVVSENTEIGAEDKEVWSGEAEHYFHHARIAYRSIKDKENIKIAFFDEELYVSHIWEHKVESKMEKALREEKFIVYLQPKYEPKNRELKGAEALIRWIDEEDGFISPGRFIPIFERNGFITRIDDYMVEHVARLQAEWIERGYDIIPVSVNISRAHFSRHDLAEHICEIVDKYKVPHNMIEIELTESAFFDDKRAILDIVNRMQQLGFHVSMDDFGAGYSSLNSLKDLPLNVLKLDGGFFKGENVGERGEIIVEKAIELAKELNMEIVAEGVEKENQVEFLADRGCDMIQGFYFDKPLPIGDFEERMNKNSVKVKIIEIQETQETPETPVIKNEEKQDE